MFYEYVEHNFKDRCRFLNHLLLAFAAERLRGLMGDGWGQILESYKQTAVAQAA